MLTIGIEQIMLLSQNGYGWRRAMTMAMMVTIVNDDRDDDEKSGRNSERKQSGNNIRYEKRWTEEVGKRRSEDNLENRESREKKLGGQQRKPGK